MAETRPCTIKVEEIQPVEGSFTYKTKKVEKEAIFHRFGDSWTYADDAKIPYTVGIVEVKETGQINQVDPTDIKFSDT